MRQKITYLAAQSPWGYLDPSRMDSFVSKSGMTLLILGRTLRLAYLSLRKQGAYVGGRCAFDKTPGPQVTLFKMGVKGRSLDRLLFLPTIPT
jgi:hypothetical protein